MPVATVRSVNRNARAANLAYDANRRRFVHGPLQPMDREDARGTAVFRALWGLVRRG